ncbi:MAG: hypothetical protein ACK5L3_15760 [Oscillospiraceae bacterium]
MVKYKSNLSSIFLNTHGLQKGWYSQAVTKKISLLILSIMAIIGLSACGSASGSAATSVAPSSNGGISPPASAQNSDGSASNSTQDAVSIQTGSSAAITLEDAKALFSEEYPNVAITIAKTEGNAYFIQGQDENYLYNFKILAADGAVVYSEKIAIGK